MISFATFFFFFRLILFYCEFHTIVGGFLPSTCGTEMG